MSFYLLLLLLVCFLSLGDVWSCDTAPVNRTLLFQHNFTGVSDTSYGSIPTASNITTEVYSFPTQLGFMNIHLAICWSYTPLADLTSLEPLLFQDSVSFPLTPHTFLANADMIHGRTFCAAMNGQWVGTLRYDFTTMISEHTNSNPRGAFRQGPLFLSVPEGINIHFLALYETAFNDGLFLLPPSLLIPQVVLHSPITNMTDLLPFISYNAFLPTRVSFDPSPAFLECFELSNNSSTIQGTMTLLQGCKAQSVDAVLEVTYLCPQSSETGLPHRIPITFDQSNIILLNRNITYNLDDPFQRFVIHTDRLAPPQHSLSESPLRLATLASYPSLGELVGPSGETFPLNSKISLSSTQFVYIPRIPSCVHGPFPPHRPCPISPGPSFLEDSFLISLENFRGQESVIATRTILTNLAIYPGFRWETDTPYNLTAVLDFPVTDTILGQSPFVVIYTTPLFGTLACYDHQGSHVLLQTHLLPFVSNSTCTFSANTTSLQSFDWSYTHPTLALSSQTTSVTSITPKRVNQAPSFATNKTIYEAQVNTKQMLSMSIIDPDWAEPLANDYYVIRVLSKNKRVSLYLSDDVHLFGVVKVDSVALVEILANSTCVNSILSGMISFTGGQTAVAEITVTIINYDDDAWRGVQPEITQPFTINILAGNPTSSTKKSANDVIKNSSILLAVVIGIPVIIVILLVIIFVRRKLKRSKIEKQRQTLIAGKILALTQLGGEAPQTEESIPSKPPKEK